ncbi:hypothetical protein EZV62_019660 [Acer yangbiense]|uniref:Integrase catalytic domain-containing protein n=1 Tax=Acer yangbiense TaxID=1000413 RepID=A0A5C7HBM4_9ROSI|nr:hypothetical protein EZV62_019660 [Acer yangbiense]
MDQNSKRVLQQGFQRDGLSHLKLPASYNSKFAPGVSPNSKFVVCFSDFKCSSFDNNLAADQLSCVDSSSVVDSTASSVSPTTKCIVESCINVNNNTSAAPVSFVSYQHKSSSQNRNQHQGLCILLGDNLITWGARKHKSHRQIVMAISHADESSGAASEPNNGCSSQQKSQSQSQQGTTNNNSGFNGSPGNYQAHMSQCYPNFSNFSDQMQARESGSSKLQALLVSNFNSECTCTNSVPVTLCSHCSTAKAFSAFHVNRIKPCSVFNSAVHGSLLKVWHSKLGHPAFPIVKQVLRKLNLPCSTPTSLDFCDACQYGKAHQLPFTASDTVYKAPLEMVFTDVWGPSPHASSQGYRYYVHFIDAYSRYTWIYPISLKSQVKDMFILFQKHVELALDRKIKCVQSDWGGLFPLTSSSYDKGQSSLSSLPVSALSKATLHMPHKENKVQHHTSYPLPFSHSGTSPLVHRDLSQIPAVPFHIELPAATSCPMQPAPAATSYPSSTPIEQEQV